MLQLPRVKRCQIRTLPFDEENIIDANPAQRLLARLAALRVRHGREDSFKLVHPRVIGARVLIGVESASMASERLLALATELGMPHACLEVLLPRTAEANAVFFGFEDLGASWLCKVYLEFWDQVRRETRRTGSQAPQLLHLGVKWDSARPDRHEVARYDCHPLLDVRAILRRMAACYGQAGAPELCELAQAIVRAAAQRNRQASLLYLEVSEQGNPRASFDINLYKSGMRVADAEAQLRQAGTYFQAPAALLEQQLHQLGPCALGHLSSGMDRHGKPFLTVYGES